jgi:hypothetical protein
MKKVKQINPDFLTQFYDLFYIENDIEKHYSENQKKYEILFEKVNSKQHVETHYSENQEKHIDILVCGAGAGILDFPMLYSLLKMKRYDTANIIFVDINETPFKLLQQIITNHSTKTKKDLIANCNWGNNDITDKVYTEKISTCTVQYLFLIQDLELDIDIENKPLIKNTDSLDIPSKEKIYQDYLKKIIDTFNINASNKIQIKGGFDVIVMSMLLQHINYWRSLLAYTNAYLNTDGIFLYNQFGGDDYLFCADVYQGIIEDKSESVTNTQNLFLDIFKSQFSIISDNHELSPTNLDICENFFEFFGGGEQTKSDDILLSGKLSGDGIKKHFNEECYVFSTYNTYSQIIGKNDIKNVIEKIDDKKSYDFNFKLKWIAQKKITDDRIYHFNVINSADIIIKKIPLSKRRLSTQEHLNYISRSYNLLLNNSTIFSQKYLSDDDKERRKNIIYETLGLLRRFIIFRDVETITVFINDIDDSIIQPLYNEIYFGNEQKQNELIKEIRQYNEKLGKSKSSNEVFFDLYKNIYTKPFIVSQKFDTSNNKFSDDNFNGKYYEVELIHDGNDKNRVCLNTKLCQLAGKSNDVYGLFNIYKESIKDKNLVFIPCFRDNFTNTNKSEKEFTASFIISYDNKLTWTKEQEKDTLGFYISLVKKYVDYTNIGNSIDFIRYRNNIRRESIKSAIAAIMSRNMSHNLGSHVISGTKNYLANAGYILKDKKDGKGIYHLYQYLQERMDFIAMVTEGNRNKNLYKAPLNLKADILDIFAVDGRDKRHNKDNASHQIKSFLLNYVINSEKIVRDNPKDGEQKLEVMLLREVEENGIVLIHSFSSEANGDNDTNTFNDINFSVPLGINSRHAFLTILENYIRNSAKHNKKPTIPENTLVLSIMIEEAKIKDNQGNEIDGYNITIFDNKPKVVHTDKKSDPEWKAKQIEFLNADGSLKTFDKGIKEILISAAWLNGETDDMSRFEKENSEKIFTYKEQNLQKIYNGIKAVNYKDDDDGKKRLEEKNKRLKYYEYSEETNALALKFSLQKHKYVHFEEIFEESDLNNLPSADYYVLYINNPKIEAEKIEKMFPHVVFATKKNDRFYIGENDNEIEIQKETINDAIFLEKCYEIKNYNDKSNKYIAILYKTKPNDLENECKKIIRKDESEDLGIDVNDLYIFSNHNDTPNIFTTKYKEYKKAYSNLKFLEGLSGASYNYNLLENAAIDTLKYYKIREACDLKIAIVDERIYNKFKNIVFSNNLNVADIERVNKEILENKSDISKITNDAIDILKKHLYVPGDTDKNVKERVKTFIQAGKGIPITYNYNKIFPESKNIFIFDYKDDRLMDLDENKYDRSCNFDFISVHYSIIQDKFGKQGEKFSSNKYSQFIEQYIGKDKYNYRTIHSGRGGTNGTDDETFITLSAIESCLEDCKYQLSQLFLNLKYKEIKP